MEKETILQIKKKEDELHIFINGNNADILGGISDVILEITKQNKSLTVDSVCEYIKQEIDTIINQSE